MKQLIALFLIILSTVSCTKNNGDIGDMFGLWKIVEVDSNGVVDSAYQGNLFLAFQSSSVTITEVYEHSESLIVFGKWQREGDIMDLIFMIEGENPQIPPATSHFAKGNNPCKIITLNNNKFIFSFVANDGKTYTYHLKKWN